MALWRLSTRRSTSRKFERLYAAAEKYNLPLFISTHGHADVLASVAGAHPGLTMIVDHLGVSQSPVSPPRPEPWDRLPGLLSLAPLPNVHVKSAARRCCRGSRIPTTTSGRIYTRWWTRSVRSG